MEHQVRFQLFKSTFSSWETLLAEAAAFASQLEPGQLISVSHSADQGKGVVVVWYWAEADVPSGLGPAENL